MLVFRGKLHPYNRHVCVLVLLYYRSHNLGVGIFGIGVLLSCEDCGYETVSILLHGDSSDCFTFCWLADNERSTDNVKGSKNAIA